MTREEYLAMLAPEPERSPLAIDPIDGFILYLGNGESVFVRPVWAKGVWAVHESVSAPEYWVVTHRPSSSVIVEPHSSLDWCLDLAEYLCVWSPDFWINALPGQIPSRPTQDALGIRIRKYIRAFTVKDMFT